MQLSVVVTIVDCGAALNRCLAALANQLDADQLEVIIPYDDSLDGMERTREEFARFTFLPLGRIETKRPSGSAAGQHELFDKRRAAGLARARGDLVAILEDRGVPRATWARTVIAKHRELPYAVIGGAIDNGRDTHLNWAVYFCDFGRYQPPFDAGPRDYVSDVNICYKRRALEATRDLWHDRYHETTVHWALLRAGETLFLSPDFVVDEFRDDLRMASLLSERVDWGRLFAYTRAREGSIGRRLYWAAMSPVLPALLFLRLTRHQIRTGRRLAQFAASAPATLLLLMAWSIGEMVGYITAKP